VPRLLAVRLLALLAVAIVLSACQVRVASDIGVNADGSGTLALTVAIDRELWESLTADGFDPFADVAPLADSGWTATVEPDDGGQRLALQTDFATPGELAVRVAELNTGLAEEDPRILDAPVLTVTEDTATLRMQAGLVPPSSTGVEGATIEFDGDALAELLATRGTEVFRHDLRVTMPGPIDATDADEVDGRTAVWNLPADGMRDVTVNATVGPSNRTLLVALAAGVLTLALVGVTVAVVRRRRADRPLRLQRQFDHRA